MTSHPPILPRDSQSFRRSRSAIHRTPGLEQPGFAGELRRQRERQGLSQSKLAARAGCDHSYVSRLESDSRDPLRETVINLSAALRCDDVARDRLLASAGFMPIARTNLYDDEPVICQLLTLVDSELPDSVYKRLLMDVRDAVGTARYLKATVEQAERAAS